MDILIIVLSITSIAFFLAYTSALYRLKDSNRALNQMIMIYNTMMENSGSSNQDIDIHKENFIKFLSDSREWAFGYIEEVQAGLKKFVEEVEPEISYYNRYGAAVEGMIPPHDSALKKISKEFEDLKKFLPEETNDRR